MITIAVLILIAGLSWMLLRVESRVTNLEEGVNRSYRLIDDNFADIEDLRKRQTADDASEDPWQELAERLELSPRATVDDECPF